MHDIKYIRKNPDEFDAAMKRRGLDKLSHKILEIDKNSRSEKNELQNLQEEANKIAKQIGEFMAKGMKDEAENAKIKSKELKQKIQDFKNNQNNEGEETSAELKNILSTIPNILASDVPDGNDENNNKEVRKFGIPKNFSFEPQAHFDIGEKLNLLDFEKTAIISGARFASTFGNLSRLERALAAFMIDTAINEFGYMECSVPYLVRDNAAFGTGQLPKFEEDLFKTTTGHYLIPTAEIPVTNLVAQKILKEEHLPLRLAAYTPCFRSEAGSAGKDTRGLIRMHQFSKVELVSITKPEESDDEHERLTSCSEKILQKLDLPYRVMLLCSGDTGFGSSKTYDIEVFLPAQKKYREISSCSNFKSFQARRMNARYRKTSSGELEFVHTLNGSSLAVGRTIVAILENYQNSDGTVTIPEVLLSYMGGIKKLEKIELF
ncbi:MAG TPA: serine--tRNA ligase [Alphaproteobacteria bacterium]|nr:serine--tRNA ligase [Alphaproteobacteria bacterium]